MTTNNETPAEVLAEMREYENRFSHIAEPFADRLERSLAAGKAQHVALLDKRGDEILCHDVPKFSRELADGHYRLYTAPPADPAKASEPEVTESMVTGLLREYLRREPSEEGIVELDDTVSREFARGLLTAALQQQEGKSHG